jgi:hypothetical protein
MAHTATADDYAERPPYAFAALAALVVLLGYIASLAPSVTFWDAGEFIAAAHILGIPHPPGTPLFVLLGRTWDLLSPLPTAFTTNLMSATFSAGSAGFLFLFMHAALARGTEGMDPATAKWFRIGGAFSATLVAAFTFTVWQNSVETEVYQVAMFSIGLMAWLCWLWRRDRGGKRGSHELLLLIYVLGAALGNHLMAILVGPAIIGFMFYVLRSDPAPQAAEAREQWIEWGVVASLWVIMVGAGIASFTIITLGYLLFLTALWFAAPVLAGILAAVPLILMSALGGTVPDGVRVGLLAGMARSLPTLPPLWAVALIGVAFVSAIVVAHRQQRGLFPVVALLVSLVGVSTYLFLYVRAGLQPFINEADPSTLRNLWAVMGREQYPPRSPFDNPIYPSGEGNPGRFIMPYDFNNPAGGGRPSLVLFGLQIGNYLQYFNWQFANGIQRMDSVIGPIRILVTLVFIALGIYGATEQRKWDKGIFWFHFIAWATTSVGLILYLNFKPGFSIGYQWPDGDPLFPSGEMHEVRERDYFYTVSFVFFGLWAGLGVAVLFERLRNRLGNLRLASGAFLLALVPFSLNFTAASRKLPPSAMLPRDFAYNMLQSVEPYGILFTNGDNDTFPLWYAQEVEGIRRDVMVVNLSLANTDWYVRQLRDNPARPYEPDSTALALYGRVEGPPPSCTDEQLARIEEWGRAAGRRPFLPGRGRPMCLHTFNDQVITTMQPQLLGRPFTLRAGNLTHTYPANTPMYVKDIVVVRLIQEQWGKRPIFFALTAGSGARMDLDRFITQRAMVFKLHGDSVQPSDSVVRIPSELVGMPMPLVDVAWTRRLAYDAYRYARLFEVDSLQLDPTDENISSNLSFPFRVLGLAALTRNNAAAAVDHFARAAQLTPGDGSMREYIAQLRAVSAAPQLFPADTSGARDTAGAGAAKRE